MPRTLLAAVLAATALGCAREQVYGAPTLQIFPAGADEARFTWTAPTEGEVMQYLLETRQPPADFRVVMAYAANKDFGSYVFPASVPEGTDHEFRLRALPEPNGLRASAPVRFRRGLRSPTVRVQAIAGGVVLELVNESLVADVLEITRKVVLCGTLGQLATTLQVPGATTRWEDPVPGDWSDGSLLQYQVTARKGTQRSAVVPVSTPPSAMNLPSGVGVTQGPEGNTVRLVNESRCASAVEVRVERPWYYGPVVPGLRAAAPPVGTAVTILHTAGAGLGEPGLYGYRACVLSASSSSCGPLLLQAMPGAGLSAQVVDTPIGRRVLRVAGGFASAAALSGGGAALRAPGLAGVDLHEEAQAYPLALVPDLQGRPHLLLSSPAALSSRYDLRHAWHDGQAWQVEVVATDQTAGTAALAVGADGTLHAAWGSYSMVSLARRDPAGWSAPVDGPRMTLSSPLLLAGDAAGAPHLFEPLAGLGSSLFRWSFQGGAWVHEDLTAPAFGLGRPRAVAGTPAGFVLVGYDAAAMRFSTLSQVDGAWGAAEVFGDYDPATPITSPSTPLEVAISPDGRRVVAAIRRSEASTERWLWVKDVSGVTLGQWFTVGRPFLGVYSEFSVGFGPDGKAWLLENVTDTPPVDDLPSVLFEEP